MNAIRVIGQAITSTNYATARIFDFNPEPVRAMAENFLAAGIDEVEIPQGVLDPDGRSAATGVDRERVARTVGLLPRGTRVVATYLGSGSLGDDNDAYLAAATRTLDDFCAWFPDCRFAMLHPPGPSFGSPSAVQAAVDTWARLAGRAARARPGFQVGFHNHYDTSAESADQVRTWLRAIERAGEPALRWAPDTGHCHGMGEAYLEVLDAGAHLVGDFFHLKARVAAFDSRHEGARYRRDRDIWNAAAEAGRGLYGGFVCCADPEVETPFGEVFRILREKARPADGVLRGSLEIDVPRQHPRLEILCAVLYLRAVHGIETGRALACREVVERVFGVRR